MVVETDDMTETDSSNDTFNTDSYTAQLQSYLDLKVQMPMDGAFDVTRWWEANRVKFPELFSLYMQFNLLPPTSSVVEGEFSQTGAVITDRRSQLKPKNVNALMISRNDCFKYSEYKKRKAENQTN